MNEFKEKVLACKTDNPHWGYKRIAATVGCSPNTVKYHLNETARSDNKRRVFKYRKSNPLRTKLIRFGEECRWYYRVKQMNKGHSVKVDFDELLEKIGENPVCYLTGDPIDLSDSRSYHLDHKIPRTRGGTNSLDNLEIASKQANQAKSDLTPEELFVFCQKVLEHNGYQVSKTENKVGFEPTVACAST